LTHPDGFGSPVGKLEASTHYQTWVKRLTYDILI
jgi:hypothetical protein